MTNKEKQISDTISRQAAINALCAICGDDCDKSEFVYNVPQDEQVILCPEHYCLCTLPSVQSERKTGEWINNTYCSECGWANQVEPGFIGPVEGFNFCPNCGASMGDWNDE